MADSAEDTLEAACRASVLLAEEYAVWTSLAAESVEARVETRRVEDEEIRRMMQEKRSVWGAIMNSFAGAPCVAAAAEAAAPSEAGAADAEAAAPASTLSLSPEAKRNGYASEA
jgi:hypothetical protein